MGFNTRMDPSLVKRFVTARIRRMFVCPRGEVLQSDVLSQVTSPRSFLGVPQSQVVSQVTGPRSFLGGGSTPVPCSFPGHWSQVLSWEYPSPRFFPRLLVPGPLSGGGGTPVLARGVGGGTPPARSGWGTPPPSQVRQSVHLLCSRQYTSCGHAGGLSCLTLLPSTYVVQWEDNIFTLFVCTPGMEEVLLVLSLFL